MNQSLYSCDLCEKHYDYSEIYIFKDSNLNTLLRMIIKPTNDYKIVINKEIGRFFCKECFAWIKHCIKEAQTGGEFKDIIHNEKGINSIKKAILEIEEQREYTKFQELAEFIINNDVGCMTYQVKEVSEIELALERCANYFELKKQFKKDVKTQTYYFPEE